MAILKTYQTELNADGHNVLIETGTYEYETNVFDNPKKTADMMNRIFHLRKKAEEYVYLLALNVGCECIGIFELSHGMVNASICNPREAFIRALLCGASSIILVHNHPSGNAAASDLDQRTWQQFQKAGTLLGIPVLDSIIIGNTTYSLNKDTIE